MSEQNQPVDVGQALARTGGAPRLVAFDLDDTLAPSKGPLPDETVVALRGLLRTNEVCVISGGAYEQFARQVLGPLESLETGEHWGESQRERLHLLPTCGTRYHRRLEGEWREVWARDLTPEERADAARALEEEARALGLWCEHPWGPILEDRGSQLTFSALGQRAPLEQKRAWDPRGTRRAALRAAVAARLPGLEVRSGGSTSVDVTRRGIDKAFGLTALAEALRIDLSDAIFVGDRLDPEGNDFPVLRTGIAAVPVRGPQETVEVIAAIRASLAAR